MSNSQHSPYGSWRSPITSDLIAADVLSLIDVMLDGDDVYWIEGRAREAGRHVLVRWSQGDIADVTPPPFNARTRVHEYGGGAVCVANGTAYFSHFKDQRLHRLSVSSGTPQPITPQSPDNKPLLRYANGIIDAQRQRWIGVREDHRKTGREAVNTLVAIDPTAGGEGSVLVSGSDFYSSPCLSPDGQRLAWLCWNHPNMPWDGTELWVGEITSTGELAKMARVAGGPKESVFQPQWGPDGRLFFISDRSGWWNLYCWENDKSVALCPKDAEFGQAQWVFGMSTYAVCSGARLLCSYSDKGLGRLATLDLPTGKLTALELPFTSFSAVRALGERAAFIAGSPSDPASVVVLDLKTGKHEVLRVASAISARPEIRRCLSRPQSIEFPTENGLIGHANYYPPHHPDFAAPAGECPPLVVKCHGGPTSTASSVLDLRTQYWTSRGIAVLDVNYGGSTGFGRAYRDRLIGAWGVVDVDDCVNAARHLIEQGLADPDRVVITGGSAGGYTTLAALAFRDFFKGGASHYGVSDLEALVRDTHKFESRYLDGLIGVYPAQKAIYEQRSPIHFAKQVKSPVIFFQGDEDEIVPPNQTEVMVSALRENGIPVGYLLFSGEQHGFRQGPNIQRALDAELYFYAVLVFNTGLSY